MKNNDPFYLALIVYIILVTFIIVLCTTEVNHWKDKYNKADSLVMSFRSQDIQNHYHVQENVTERFNMRYLEFYDNKQLVIINLTKDSLECEYYRKQN
jgi:hypothetical protein